MKAMVTGCSGFVGRNFCRRLYRAGWQVRGCDIQVQHNAMDVFSWDDTQYDLVVHAAYNVGGRKGIDGTNSNFIDNSVLDSAMFSWGLRTDQKAVLYLSSSAVYPVDLQRWENQGERLYEGLVDFSSDETLIGVPDAGYGWAKLTGERMACVANGLGLPVYVVRPFSGYGEDQSTDYPFRSFIERAKAHEDPFTVWGDPKQVRDWIHISDVIEASLAIIEADYRKPVNLCSGIGVSMEELAMECMELAGYSADIKPVEDAPMGVFHRVGDPTRMSEFYAPKVSLTEGIERALRA